MFGGSANPDASPPRVSRGPAVAEAGSCMPWKLAQVRPSPASASSAAGEGADARRTAGDGRAAGVVRAWAGGVWLGTLKKVRCPGPMVMRSSESACMES
jgi:hypothetical protein